jgi:hypothetical protein
MKIQRTCAECGAPFTSKRPNATFCCREHADSFMNRKKVRGATLLEMYFHKRYNRQAATQARIPTIIDRMVANWHAEDVAAGRQSMLGLEDVLERNTQHVPTRQDEAA